VAGSGKPRSILGIFANVMVVVSSAFLIFTLIRTNTSIGKHVTPAARDPREYVKAGDTILLPDIDWKGNHETMLVAVRPGCHFCSDSAGFYRQIMAYAQRSRNVRVIALTPEPVSAGKQYFLSLHVDLPDVRQADLRHLSIRGTPTLLLVDSHGIATKVWVGKLPKQLEQQVLGEFRQSSSAPVKATAG
jgi:hypothetical protein